ncbi:hypothetical protein PTKU46_85380 [Paraburkholderia terrae]
MANAYAPMESCYDDQKCLAQVVQDIHGDWLNLHDMTVVTGWDSFAPALYTSPPERQLPSGIYVYVNRPRLYSRLPTSPQTAP